MYPYGYMDSFKKFSEDKLRDRHEFYSSLKDECISEKDYLASISLSNKFKKKKIINLRSDPYKIKRDLLDNAKHGYKNYKKKCASWNNFLDEATAIKCFATGWIFKIRRDMSN